MAYSEKVIDHYNDPRNVGSLDKNNEKIEIIGTYVVPEFYEIAPLVLATSFIGLIVLRKYKKLFV